MKYSGIPIRVLLIINIYVVIIDMFYSYIKYLDESCGYAAILLIVYYCVYFYTSKNLFRLFFPLSIEKTGLMLLVMFVDYIQFHGSVILQPGESIGSLPSIIIGAPTLVFIKLFGPLLIFLNCNAS